MGGSVLPLSVETELLSRGVYLSEDIYEPKSWELDRYTSS